MASRPETDPLRGANVVLDVLPIGLTLAGIAAVTRGLLVAGRPVDGLDEEARSFLVLAQAEQWPDVLAEALIAYRGSAAKTAT